MLGQQFTSRFNDRLDCNNRSFLLSAVVGPDVGTVTANDVSYDFKIELVISYGQMHKYRAQRDIQKQICRLKYGLPREITVSGQVCAVLVFIEGVPGEAAPYDWLLFQGQILCSLLSPKTYEVDINNWALCLDE